MIHGEAFSLFEAMSALEAGNPKMDAAASPAADRPTLDALLADLDLTAPLADLGAAGLLAVLDQLLAMEASWHTGSSAMQTVYGCLYMLRMERWGWRGGRGGAGARGRRGRTRRGSRGIHGEAASRRAWRRTCRHGE